MRISGNFKRWLMLKYMKSTATNRYNSLLTCVRYGVVKADDFVDNLKLNLKIKKLIHSTRAFQIKQRGHHRWAGTTVHDMVAAMNDYVQFLGMCNKFVQHAETATNVLSRNFQQAEVMQCILDPMVNIWVYNTLINDLNAYRTRVLDNGSDAYLDHWVHLALMFTVEPFKWTARLRWYGELQDAPDGIGLFVRDGEMYFKKSSNRVVTVPAALKPYIERCNALHPDYVYTVENLTNLRLFIENSLGHTLTSYYLTSKKHGNYVYRVKLIYLSTKQKDFETMFRWCYHLDLGFLTSAKTEYYNGPTTLVQMNQAADLLGLPRWDGTHFIMNSVSQQI